MKKSAVFFIAVFWLAAAALGSSAESNSQTRSDELPKAEKARNIERLTAEFERLGQLYIKRKSDDYLNFAEEKFWSDKCPLTHRKMMYLAIVCGANWVKLNRNEFPEGYGNYFALPFANPRRNKLMANALLDKVEMSLKKTPEKFAYLLKIYAKDPYYDGTQWYFYSGVLRRIWEKYVHYKKYLPSGERYREVALELGMSHLNDMGELAGEPLEFQKELFKHRAIRSHRIYYFDAGEEKDKALRRKAGEIEIGMLYIDEALFFGAETIRRRCTSGSEPFEVEFSNPDFDWRSALKVLDNFEQRNYNNVKRTPKLISDVYKHFLKRNSAGFTDSNDVVYSGKIMEELEARREKFFKISKPENAKSDDDKGGESGKAVHKK